MTIAAGMVCSDGLVLFADSEEQEGYTKTSTEKVQKHSHKDAHLVIANAGHGHLADSLIDQIFDAVDGTKNNKEIIHVIRTKIIDFHKNEVAFYPAENEAKQVGLIIGVQIGKSTPILMHANGPALRKVSEFAIIGYGVQIKFLAQQLYDPAMPLKHGILIANYLCKTAKDYVQGCGGISKIATVSNGQVEILHFVDVWDEERLFSLLAANYRAILLSIPDRGITADQFNNCVEWFVEQAWKERGDMLMRKETSSRIKSKLDTWDHENPSGISRYYGPVDHNKFHRYPDLKREFERSRNSNSGMSKPETNK